MQAEAMKGAERVITVYARPEKGELHRCEAPGQLVD